MTPEQAWKLASDLGRFDEWLTIFAGWRSEVPEVIEKGTQVSSLLKIKGFRNTIEWTVTEYDEPRRITLRGNGFGGVRISLDMSVDRDDEGSRFRVLAELGGGVLSGPIGTLSARVVKGDVTRSVRNLAELGSG